jgi:hypothetical protein
LLATTACDLSILRPGFRNDAARLAQSGVTTAQSIQSLYQTLAAERLDVEKVDAFRSSEVKTPCEIAPLPPDDQKGFDGQITELNKRVKLAQNLLALYQSFSSETAFRSGDARSKATALAKELQGLAPVPSSSAAGSALPAEIIGVAADGLLALKQNSEIKDYAQKLSKMADAVNQIFTADKPALTALAAERREKIATFGRELMACGLVSLQPVMKDLAADTGFTLVSDEKSFAPFQKNIEALAALTPAQHINDTMNAIDADVAALASLLKAHTDFAAKKAINFAELEPLASKAAAAAQKLQTATSAGSASSAKTQ